MKAGYVNLKRVYIESKAVYVPAKAAVMLLRAKGMPYALGISKDKDFANYLHDKTLIDLRIFFQELGIGLWVPERVIRSIKPRGSAPDALLVTRERTYAIEYERSEKKLTRYKGIFDRYLSREHYDRILYICDSYGLIGKLMAKYRPSEKIYFIATDALFDQGKEATFFSKSDGLPVKRLIKESYGGTLTHLNKGFLRKIISPAPDETRKDGKPHVRWPRSKACRETDDEDGWIDEEEKDYPVDSHMDSPVSDDESNAYEQDEII